MYRFWFRAMVLAFWVFALSCPQLIARDQTSVGGVQFVSSNLIAGQGTHVEINSMLCMSETLSQAEGRLRANEKYGRTSPGRDHAWDHVFEEHDRVCKSM